MKGKDLLILSLLTLFTVVFWMVSQFIHTAQKSTVTPVLQEQIKPLSPSFDTSVIKQLKSRLSP